MNKKEKKKKNKKTGIGKKFWRNLKITLLTISLKEYFQMNQKLTFFVLVEIST